jgi:hypothetical protein
VTILFSCRTEPTYDVDKHQLEARYKRLQKDLHPDKFGGRDAQQQEYSAEQSSLVNHAYAKLKSPLQRALYLVSTAFTNMGTFCNIACMQNTFVEHVLHRSEAQDDQVFAAANFWFCCTYLEVVSSVLQLERKGKPAPEDGGTISDPALLMEVMEQRELVEQTNDVGILQVMLQENKLLEQATTEA